MTVQNICKIQAVVALLCSQTVNAFVHPATTFGLQAPGTRKTNTPVLQVASVADLDLTRPPDFEIKDTYQQGEVPMFAVVNATLRTSELIYAFSSVKIDIRENPDEWLDGKDMLKEGILLEEDIGDFVKKNRERVEGNEDFAPMIAYQMGLKGDNRIRCVDAKYATQELVYGINVNRSRKQATVAFRGTNTIKDVLVDLDLRKYPYVDGDESYDIHNGFRGYLNADTADETDGDNPKLDQITDNLEEIMEDCEGFDVFVTGHSLGGALATLYGLRLAETKKFPVVNILSYASPYVGTEGFRKVFRQAELDGIVRHIRVSNTNDCIPANPCIGGFSHVGVNLALRSSGPVMNYEGLEQPSLPAAFVVLLVAGASLLVNFLSLFIGFLSVLPTLPLPLSLLLAYSTVNILLDNHGFEEYRKRLTTGVENTDFFTKTIEQLYEERLESIKTTGV